MCSANRTSNKPSLPTYCKEIATSLLPIVLMFDVFQLVALKLDRRTLGRIGVVAMVAMTPLITVQLMGLMAQLKQRRARSAQPVHTTPALAFADLPDDAIIEL